jgi:uncharacterized repeat protein (TIGR01451 family)/LPXTG-motif cell wall-anchored protein
MKLEKGMLALKRVFKFLIVAEIVIVLLSINTVDAAIYAPITKLTASDGAAGDQFGNTAAISGDTIVVGAKYDDDKGTDSGAAYVFARNKGGVDNWGDMEKLTAADGAAGDRFGQAVSINDDTAVVGAYYDDDKGADSGSAYVFSPHTDLAITKTGNSAAVVGTNFSYFVKITNNGPSDASGVKVTDILPAGVIYSSSTLSKGNYNSSTGFWTVNSLTSGETETLILEVTASALPNTVITNTAQVIGNEIDSVSNNNSASQNTRVVTSVGGEVNGISKSGILAPWLALCLLLAAGGFFLLFRRRKKC